MQDSNLPAARESTPDFMSNVGSDAAPTIALHHKKFRYIPDLVIVDVLRLPLYENESGEYSVDRKKKRVPIGIAPVQRKRQIAEPSVGSQSQIIELAEVVGI